MFKTESLLAFIAVVESGSFTAAGMSRGQTPMAMSKKIAQLEKQLSEALFERSTRKVKLTEFGESFLVKARQILLAHESLEHWLDSRQGKISGKLKVVSQSLQTYQETIYPYLAEFVQQYPDLQVSLDVQERVIDLDKEPCDIYWGVGEYLGQMHPGLKCRSMWRAQYGIYASPEYLAKYGTPKTPQDLSSHKMIGHVHQNPSNILVINHQPHSEQKELEVMEVDTAISVVGGKSTLAVQGLGLINAGDDDYDIVNYVKSGELVPVLADYWYQQAEVYIYYQQVKFEQAKVRAFIDFFLSKRAFW